MPLNRRGVSLAELLIALTLTLLIAVVTGGILDTAARRLRDRSERIALEQSLRMALASGRAVLGPLGADSAAGADLWSATPTSLVARVTRASGVLCAAYSDRVLARAGAPWWQALRVPVPGRDSLLISVGKGSAWRSAPLSAAPGIGVCPDGSSALLLPTILAAADLGPVGPGSVIRVVEPVELRVYSSAGATWIGLRQVMTGEAIQPLAGPFGTAPAFHYETAGGGTPGSPGEVGIAWLTLAGVSEHPGGVGLARVDRVQHDTLSLAILLRGFP